MDTLAVRLPHKERKQQTLSQNPATEIEKRFLGLTCLNRPWLANHASDGQRCSDRELMLELTSFDGDRRLRNSVLNLRPGGVDARLTSEDRELTRRLELSSISRALRYCMG